MKALTDVAHSNFSVELIVFNILLSALLGAALAWFYKQTHRGFSYSQSFVISIALIPVVSTVAMMIIGNNIVSAFALLGTFAIIRFRTPIKDVKDMVYIFLALVAGLGVGTGSYKIALIGVIFMIGLFYLFYKMNFASIRRYGYILTFVFDGKIGDDEAFKALFKKYCKSHSMLNVQAIKDGHTLEFTFNIHFKDKNMSEEFVLNLSENKGVSGVNLMSAKNDIEV